MRRTPPQKAAARGRTVEDAEPVLQHLDQVLEDARRTLDDPQAQEADFRDRLYEMKKANEEADPYWLIVEISRSSAYSGAIREVKDRLLAKAKAQSPQITSWEKAIDPACRVSEISTRAVKRQVRPFQPPLPLLRFLQGERTSEGRKPEDESGNLAREESVETNRSALRVPVEPSPSESLPSQTQPPVGAGIRQGREEARDDSQDEVRLTKGMLNGIQNAVNGMNRFLAHMEERENRYAMEQEWGDPEELPRVTRSERKNQESQREEGPSRRKAEASSWPQSPWASARSPANHPVSFIKMVGAKEKEKEKWIPHTRRQERSRPPPDLSETDGEEDESLEYFKKMYEDECEEIKEMDLGPDFIYPSQKAFDRYIGEFDFMKHLKHGTLAKFDGTVKGYLRFKKNFFKLVYAQRIGYLHKLMALEYMIPEKLQNEMFYDLDNSPGHFGMRIKRLEQRF